MRLASHGSFISFCIDTLTKTKVQSFRIISAIAKISTEIRMKWQLLDTQAIAMHSNDRMSKSSMVFCNTCSIFCVAKRFESGWQVLMSVVYIVHPIYSLTVTMKHPQVQINNEHCRKNQVKQTVYDNHLIVWWRLLLLSTKIYLFIYFVNSFLFRSLARSLLPVQHWMDECVLCVCPLVYAPLLDIVCPLKYSCWKHKRWWAYNFHIRLCCRRFLLLCTVLPDAKTFHIM